MANLKRDPVKYVRDRAKAKYQKGKECEICGATEDLDFHHFYSLSPLLHNWIQRNRLDPNNVLEFRDEFIEAHIAELYHHAVTLCRSHHLKLHSVYGRNPPLGTAKKQMRWVNIQRDKHGVV